MVILIYYSLSLIALILVLIKFPVLPKMLICSTVFLKMKRECTVRARKVQQNGHKGHPITWKAKAVKTRSISFLIHICSARYVTLSIYYYYVTFIGVARGWPRGPWPPKCSEHMVILCLERRYPKQNSVIRRKSNILAPPNFWAGCAGEYIAYPLTPEVTIVTRYLWQSVSCDILWQWWAICGQRDTRGPPQLFQWPAYHSRKSEISSNL